jgi:hypothetical protein
MERFESGNEFFTRVRKAVTEYTTLKRRFISRRGEYVVTRHDSYGNRRRSSDFGSWTGSSREGDVFCAGDARRAGGGPRGPGPAAGLPVVGKRPTSSPA